MEAVKLGKFIEEELEDFCAGCDKDDLCIRHKWVFGDNDHATGKRRSSRAKTWGNVLGYTIT